MAQNPLSAHSGDAQAGGLRTPGMHKLGEIKTPPGCPGWRRSGPPGGLRTLRESSHAAPAAPRLAQRDTRASPEWGQAQDVALLRDWEVAQRKEGEASPSLVLVTLGTRWGVPSPCQPLQPSHPPRRQQFGGTGTVAPRAAAPTHPRLSPALPAPQKILPQGQRSHLPAFPAHTGAQSAPHALPGCCALCTDINGSGGKKIL